MSVYESDQAMHDRMVSGSHIVERYRDTHFGGSQEEDVLTIAGDAVADILHYCAYKGVDPEEVIAKGQFHYKGDFEDAAEPNDR